MLHAEQGHAKHNDSSAARGLQACVGGRVRGRPAQSSQQGGTATAEKRRAQTGEGSRVCAGSGLTVSGQEPSRVAVSQLGRAAALLGPLCVHGALQTAAAKGNAGGGAGELAVRRRGKAGQRQAGRVRVPPGRHGCGMRCKTESVCMCAERVECTSETGQLGPAK